jgi:hypothetical protein
VTAHHRDDRPVAGCAAPLRDGRIEQVVHRRVVQQLEQPERQIGPGAVVLPEVAVDSSVEHAFVTRSGEPGGQVARCVQGGGRGGDRTVAERPECLAHREVLTAGTVDCRIRG